MARYFHGGPHAVDPKVYASQATDEEQRKLLETEAQKHHPLTHPHRDSLKREGDKVKIRRPSMFCPLTVVGRDQQGNPIHGPREEIFDDWEPGSITLGLPGVGFFVVPPGGHVDIDNSVPEKTVKAMAPHLLTEAEAMSRGLLEPPREMKKQTNKPATSSARTE